MSNFKFVLFGSSILVVAALQAPAFAEETASGNAVDEVVITGSRLVVNGNQAPTPVTVMDTKTLQLSAPSNIPDGLNQLPQFSGSRSDSASSGLTAITPSAGNYLNLRNLGFVRGLILLDGQRVPPTSFEGIVDTNLLPEALVQRVDVVTAGASAAYGSDAVTGVVNFILDKNFNGLKASVQGGISQYGDRNSYRISVAGGTSVLNGRGHLEFSVEHYDADGVKDQSSRPNYSDQPIAFGNGTTVPFRTEYNARIANSTFGGLILSGPLINMKFEPNGSLSKFNAGSVTPVLNLALGGDGALLLGASLVGALRTDQVFVRGSYDITDNITGFLQGSFGESRTRYDHIGVDSRFGNITIFSGNAYLQPQIQQVLTATNTPSFTFSRTFLESGEKVVDILNDDMNVFAGLEGKLPGDWSWRATYAGGESIMRAEHTRNPDNTKLTAATDAVKDSSGNIVCRVTITNPGVFPGCVPINLFGVGAPSAAALAYIYGANSQYQARNEINDFAVDFRGTVMQLPAGPLLAATGVEYRNASLKMTSNADPATPLVTTGLRGFASGQGLYGNTNQGATDGKNNVTEGFLELQVPVLKDLPFVDSFDLNAAGRVTNYSTSGRVETWKLGFSYAPISDLRFRGTLSQDIRAPTLQELFAGQQLHGQTFNDPHTNLSGDIATINSGNPDLKPEIGRTKTIGFVYQPSWLSGFTASVDYFDIDIKNAITTETVQQIAQDCEDSNGTGPSCALIVRPNPFSDRSAANRIQQIIIAPLNLAENYTHGIDVDAGYRFPLSKIWEANDGVISLRALFNYTPSNKLLQKVGLAPIQQAGLGGVANTGTGNPIYRGAYSANYEKGPWTVNVQERYIGSIKRSLLPNMVYVDNVIPAVWYTNLAVAYKFKVGGHDLEAFANINNLFNKDAPLVPSTTLPGIRYSTAAYLYDVIGRYYTGGLRMRF
jgi:iron complex outermembrane receptor protein